MVKGLDARLTLLRSAAKTAETEFFALKEKYSSRKIELRLKKEEILRKKEERVEAKRKKEIFEKSIFVLNGMAKIFEEFSIRYKLENLLSEIVSVLMGQDNSRIVLNKKHIRKQQELYIEQIQQRDGKYFPIELSHKGGGVRDIVDTVMRILILQQCDEAKRLLILDEPLKALDTGLRERFFKFFMHLCKEFKIQVLMITHEIEFIEEIENIVRFSYDGERTIAEVVKQAEV